MESLSPKITGILSVKSHADSEGAKSNQKVASHKNIVCNSIISTRISRPVDLEKTFFIHPLPEKGIICFLN